MQLKSNIKLEDQEYATKIRKHNFSKYLFLVFLRDMNEGNLSLETSMKNKLIHTMHYRI